MASTGIDNIGGLLKAGPGPVDLQAIDPDGRPGFDGDKKAGKAALADLEDQLARDGVVVVVVGAARWSDREFAPEGV